MFKVGVWREEDGKGGEEEAADIKISSFRNYFQTYVERDLRQMSRRGRWGKRNGSEECLKKFDDSD